MTDKILEALEFGANNALPWEQEQFRVAATLYRAELEARKVPDDLREMAEREALGFVDIGVIASDKIGTTSFALTERRLAAVLLAVRDDATAKERERVLALFADIEAASENTTPGPWSDHPGGMQDQIGGDEEHGAWSTVAMTPCPKSPVNGGRHHIQRKVIHRKAR